jgi:Nitroreductase family
VNADDVDRYLRSMSEIRQVPIEGLQGLGDTIKGYLSNLPYPLDINAWSARQVYIALGQFMTSAAMLGIDTCPMEGFIPARYDEVLGLTENFGFQAPHRAGGF